MLFLWPRLSKKHVLIISCIILSIVLCSVVIFSTFVTRTTPREVLHSKSTGVLMIGGNSSESQCSLEFYSPSTNKSQLLALQLLSCRNHHASVGLQDGRILVVGGKTTLGRGQLTTETQIIDLATQQVTYGPRMLTERLFPAAAAYKDKVVVCGGLSSVEIVKSCEMLSENKWVRMKSMQIERYSPALIVVKDSLFIFGGRQLSDMGKTVVEKYSFSLDIWRSASPMKFPRTGAGVAELNQDIVVCGGYSYGLLNSCERYVVDRDRWYTFPSMNIARAEFALCTVDGMLVALGGMDRRNVAGRSIEQFDSVRYVWNSSGQLAVNRSSTSGVVVSV